MRKINLNDVLRWPPHPARHARNIQTQCTINAYFESPASNHNIMMKMWGSQNS
ncbi:uncharacterized protein MELLADRAFT_95108 [Melampsora larici-populina 98AG31]|uniref:Uncharacterized protein n=1 Tax=Melampsora larici-populina (strain 98AG31 / pathotype 3-4-7) TaxID=747676 RepID=F4RCP3_MELLP|nr:uncharacterized protein MELLADRAFT_95108 [Melampsora larici-populina 98AG31]EGG10013.1 hypothetical protein MELLADRAFT_95108 [Melampsora larici-populina 98AG31]